MYEKYAFIDGGITAYSDAGPVSGNVPPITIVRLVIPVSDAEEIALDAVMLSVRTSAAAKSRTFFIEAPSLGGVSVGRGERNRPRPRLPNTQTARPAGG